jgi:hypothetical protein
MVVHARFEVCGWCAGEDQDANAEMCAVRTVPSFVFVVSWIFRQLTTKIGTRINCFHNFGVLLLLMFRMSRSFISIMELMGISLKRLKKCKQFIMFHKRTVIYF